MINCLLSVKFRCGGSYCKNPDETGVPCEFCQTKASKAARICCCDRCLESRQNWQNPPKLRPQRTSLAKIVQGKGIRQGLIVQARKRAVDALRELGLSDKEIGEELGFPVEGVEFYKFGYEEALREYKEAYINGRKIYTVYRFYDKYKNLLYAGLTGEFLKRMRTHTAEKPWFTSVSTITLEHFEFLEEARAAELKAINTENPRYNVGDFLHLLRRGE